MFDDAANIHLAANMLVSAGDSWDGLGAGWVRLTAVDGSIINDNSHEILAAGSHLKLFAEDAIGTYSNAILTQVDRLTVANALSTAEETQTGDIVIVEKDDLELIRHAHGGALANNGFELPTNLDDNEWLDEVDWDDALTADWLNQITDGTMIDALVVGHGTIDIKLLQLDSLLSLTSGMIRNREDGSDIFLSADDIDFVSGERMIHGTGDLNVRITNDSVKYLLGSAGEASLGGDKSVAFPDNGTFDMSQRDLAAIGEEFAQVNIGHEATGNEMILGDIEDDNVSNAALTNTTNFIADRIEIRGDVQAPDNRVEFTSTYGEIFARNFHDPTGLPDSGVQGETVVFNTDEDLIIGGWLFADTLADVNVLNDNETSRLRVDSSGIVRGNTANSLVDMDSAGQIEIAGQVRAGRGAPGETGANGKDSMVQIDAIRAVEIFEGGLVFGRHSGTQIDISAGTFLHSHAGSAVTAGADFDTTSGKPVAFLTGINSDITLNSAGEIFVGGSITASRSMTMDINGSVNDFADYFDSIPAKNLFDMTAIPIVTSNLDSGIVNGALQTQFTNNGIDLSGGQTVETIEAGKRWRVIDGDDKFIVVVDANDSTILKVGESHYLDGHRGFGFLLTGTLTTLMDDVTLDIAASDDVIIRGNIDVLGDDSTLALQSDKWIYWEGFATVEGDITMLGGIAADGTDLDGSGVGDSSIYVHATSQLVTSQAGSSINLQGSHDVDLMGKVVAGGEITETGVNFAGPNSTVSISAGQQIQVDTAIIASKSVTLDAGAVGIDDNDVSVLVTTAGGLTATGWTSNRSGSDVTITAHDDAWLMGNLISGARVTQTFDDAGNLETETFNWSNETGRMNITAGGQARIGGMTENEAGEIIETGGLLRSRNSMHIVGGDDVTEFGVYVPGAAELIVNHAAGSIQIDANQGAQILGLLVAGGQVENVYDNVSKYIGRRVHYANGDSTVEINADGAIDIGQSITAGKSIEIHGGDSTLGQGTQIQGSVQLTTLRQNSHIEIDAPGAINILAPAHTNEIFADGFIATADGKLTDDVTLSLWIDKVDFEVSGEVTITAAATADNESIADLVADVQAALEAHVYQVTQSDNINHVLGSNYTFDDLVNPDVEVKLRDGRLNLTGPYTTKLLRTDSVNANLLGFTVSKDIASSLPYTMLADQAGSVIRLGSQDGNNGSLYIAGSLKAHSGIELQSGDGTNSDAGQNIDLDYTSVLETVNASIILSPGGVDNHLRGDIIARGIGSDIVINAEHSVTIYGTLEAGDDVRISAGSVTNDGEISLQTTGTAKFLTSGTHGEIVFTGHNDVSINSNIDTTDRGTTWVRLESTDGELRIERESGRIETAGWIEMQGKDLGISGVVRSTKQTTTLLDHEVMINMDGQANLQGDIQVAGSLLVSADSGIRVENMTLAVDNAGQRLTMHSKDGTVELGRTETLENGSLVQNGAVVSANRLVEIDAANVIVASGVNLLTSADHSAIRINSGDATIIGTVQAGGRLNENNFVQWSGRNTTVDMNLTGTLLIGGSGANEDGEAVMRGGTILATKLISIDYASASISSLSRVTTDSNGGGTWAVRPASLIELRGTGDLQFHGTIHSVDVGSDINLINGGQILVNGVIQANDRLTIEAGEHSSGVGLAIQPLVMNTDADGFLLTESGDRVDAAGNLIDEQGQYVDADGNVLASGADPVFAGMPQRLGGGTINVDDGGSINIVSADGIVIHGVLGDMSDDGGILSADANKITITSGGDISVSGRVDADNLLTMTADGDLNVLAGAHLQARGDGSILRVAADTLYVAAATGPVAAGLVKAKTRTHLIGNHVYVFGEVQATGDDSLLMINASDEILIEGELRGADDIRMNSGIDRAWSLATFLSPTITQDNFSDGDVIIQANGKIDAVTSVGIKAGGDVFVLSGTQEGEGTRPELAAQLSINPVDVDVITGYRQVANGVIQVPEVKFVTTTVTEQTGVDSVKVGSEFHTMDVTLEQIGYYNPNKLDVTEKVRQYFVEGVDYFNADFGWEPDYQSSVYRNFSQLNDDDRKLVLDSLGYRPLYDFTFANAKTHRTLNGNATVDDWTPEWFEANDLYENNDVTDGLPEAGDDDDLVYLVDVAGWNDKYIRMPKGAQNDVLRVVSQGEPNRIGGSSTEVAGETLTVKLVGEYRDHATTLYTQDKSDHEEDARVHENYNSLSTDKPGVDYYRVQDYDNSDARWAITYDSDGRREYSILDGRTGANTVERGRDPLWHWNSVGTVANVYDNPTDVASTVNGTFGTGRYIIVANGFLEDTAAIVNGNVVNTHVVNVGIEQDKRFDVVYTLTHYRNSRVAHIGSHVTVNIEGSNRFSRSSGSTHAISGYPDQVIYTGRHADWETIDLDVYGSANYLFVTDGYHANGDRNAQDGGWIHAFDGAVGASLSTTSTPVWISRSGTEVSETFYDYNYDWSSIWHNIYDQRLQTSYQWVSHETDIYNNRPRYETTDKETKVVNQRDVTLWTTTPVIESQTQLQAIPLSDTAPQPFREFTQEAIHAGINLTIDAGGDVRIQGLVSVDSGTIDIHGDDDLSVSGIQIDSSALAAQSSISGPESIRLSAGQDLTIGRDVHIQTTTTDSTSDRVQLLSGRDTVIDGNVDATNAITVLAGNDLIVSGHVTASQLVKLQSGTTGDRIGDVHLIGATVTTTDDVGVTGKGVQIDSGSSGGDIQFSARDTGSASLISHVQASGLVHLNANRGEIFNDLSSAGDFAFEEGLVETPKLIATAYSGIALRTLVDDVNVQTRGPGDIAINSGQAMVLSSARSYGAINVVAEGDLTADFVQTLGNGYDKNVTLVSRDPDGDGVQTGNLVLNDVRLASGADLTLRSSGTITSEFDSIIADHLTMEAAGEIDIKTRINELTIQSPITGDVSIAQLGAGDMVISDTMIRDGSFTLDLAGDLTIERLDIIHDSDDNDINITAGGDVAIDYLSAGTYYDNPADVPTPQPGIEAGLTSMGDINIIAGGKVTELGDDAAVDIIADSLSIIAGGQITDLEIAVNRLAADTTTGDIRLHERDGAGEFNEGILVTSLTTVDGSIALTTHESMELHRVHAGDTNGHLRLTSTTGNVLIGEVPVGSSNVVRPTALADGTETLQYGSELTVLAHGTISSYMMFDGAGKDIEYRAKRLDMDLSVVNAGNLILDSGDDLSIDGTLNVTGTALLASDTNVFVSGTVQNPDGTDMPSVTLRARGIGQATATELDSVTGLPVYVKINDATDEVLLDEFTDTYYTRIFNGKHVFTGSQIGVDGLVELFSDNADGTGTMYRLDGNGNFYAVGVNQLHGVKASAKQITVSAADYISKEINSAGGKITFEDGIELRAEQVNVEAARRFHVIQSGDFTIDTAVVETPEILFDVAGDLTIADIELGATEWMRLNIGGDLDLQGSDLTAPYLYINAGGHLDLQGDASTIADDTIFHVHSISTSPESMVTAETLQVITVAEVELFTTTDSIDLHITGDGNLDLHETSDLILDSVSLNNGDAKIDIAGDASIHLVETIVDGNITIITGGSMEIDRVETQSSLGMEKVSGDILLYAGTTMSEMLPIDEPQEVIGALVSVFDSNGYAHHIDTISVAPSGDGLILSLATAETNQEAAVHTQTGTWNHYDPSAQLTASVGTVVDNGDGSWTWTYVPADGPYNELITITLTSDANSGSATTSFRMFVTNVAPTISSDADVTFNEGETATNTGVWNDVGFDDVVLTTSLGTVTKNDNGTWSWNWDTSDGPDETQVVTVTATDSDGAVTDTTFQLTVNNVVPTISNNGDIHAYEGVTAINSGVWNDVGDDVVTLTASIGNVVKNDNGTWDWTYENPDGPEDTQVVTITATDSDGLAATTQFQIDVDNVEPIQVTITPVVAHVNGLRTTIAVHDPAGSGDDTAIAWTITQNGVIVKSGSNASVEFVPSEKGEYTLDVTVTDADGAINHGSTTLSFDDVSGGVEPRAYVSSPISLSAFTAGRSDAGQSPALAWRVYRGGKVEYSGTGPLINFTPKEEGVHTVTVVATDNLGLTSTATYDIDVQAIIVPGQVEIEDEDETLRRIDKRHKDDSQTATISQEDKTSFEGTKAVTSNSKPANVFGFAKASSSTTSSGRQTVIHEAASSTFVNSSTPRSAAPGSIVLDSKMQRININNVGELSTKLQNLSPDGYAVQINGTEVPIVLPANPTPFQIQQIMQSVQQAAAEAQRKATLPAESNDQQSDQSVAPTDDATDDDMTNEESSTDPASVSEDSSDEGSETADNATEESSESVASKSTIAPAAAFMAAAAWKRRRGEGRSDGIKDGRSKRTRMFT
ncbi:MAG: hypothetical protein WBD31_12175 [Rubripirellula sp.]